MFRYLLQSLVALSFILVSNSILARSEFVLAGLPASFNFEHLQDSITKVQETNTQLESVIFIDLRNEEGRNYSYLVRRIKEELNKSEARGVIVSPYVYKLLELDPKVDLELAFTVEFRVKSEPVASNSYTMGLYTSLGAQYWPFGSDDEDVTFAASNSYNVLGYVEALDFLKRELRAANPSGKVSVRCQSPSDRKMNQSLGVLSIDSLFLSSSCAKVPLPLPIAAAIESTDVKRCAGDSAEDLELDATAHMSGACTRVTSIPAAGDTPDEAAVAKVNALPPAAAGTPDDRIDFDVFNFVAEPSYRETPRPEAFEVWRSGPINYAVVAFKKGAQADANKELRKRFYNAEAEFQSDETSVHAVGFNEADQKELNRYWPFLVAADGGSTVRMGLSTLAHRYPRKDDTYFRKLRNHLLTPSRSRTGKEAVIEPLNEGRCGVFERPVYLDYSFESGDFVQMSRQLEDGEFDIVTLNAHEAGRVLHNRTGSLMASAEYMDCSKLNDAGKCVDRAAVDKYQVALFKYCEPGVIDFSMSQALADKSCIAVDRKDTSSINRYAAWFADKRGAELQESRLLKVHGAFGISRALINGRNKDFGWDPESCDSIDAGAQYGLLSRFDYEKTVAHLQEAEKKAVQEDGPAEVRQPCAIYFEEEIPNASLLFSRRFLARDEDLTDDSHWWDFRWLNPETRQQSKTAVCERVSAVQSIKRGLRLLEGIPEAETKGGFYRYQPKGMVSALNLREVYSHYSTDFVGLGIAMLVLVLLATASMVFFSYRKHSGEEIVIDRLHLGGDKQVQDFIFHAIRINQWLVEGANEKRQIEIFGSKDELYRLRERLQGSLLKILAIYQQESTVTILSEYLGALKELVDVVTIVTKQVEEWEELHNSNLPDDAPDKRTDYSSVIQQGVTLAVAIGKALSGR